MKFGPYLYTISSKFVQNLYKICSKLHQNLYKIYTKLHQNLFHQNFIKISSKVSSKFHTKFIQNLYKIYTKFVQFSLCLLFWLFWGGGGKSNQRIILLINGFWRVRFWRFLWLYLAKKNLVPTFLLKDGRLKKSYLKLCPKYQGEKACVLSKNR